MRLLSSRVVATASGAKGDGAEAPLPETGGEGDGAGAPLPETGGEGDGAGAPLPKTGGDLAFLWAGLGLLVAGSALVALARVRRRIRI